MTNDVRVSREVECFKKWTESWPVVSRPSFRGLLREVERNVVLYVVQFLFQFNRPASRYVFTHWLRPSV